MLGEGRGRPRPGPEGEKNLDLFKGRRETSGARTTGAGPRWALEREQGFARPGEGLAELKVGKCMPYEGPWGCGEGAGGGKVEGLSQGGVTEAPRPGGSYGDDRGSERLEMF